MSEYCRDDFGLVEQADDDFKMWQGLVGPHYTPSVSEDGTLSWSNDGKLPNPEDVSIKGPPGEPGPPGAPGPGVPTGGTTGQILAKASDEDYVTEWIDQPEMDAGHVSYDSTEAYDDGTVGKELTTINSALSSLSSVTEIIDTASGTIASFPDGSGLPMRSLLATIEPQQSGTGDPSPENVRPISGWTGLSGKRCGKNLFDTASAGNEWVTSGGYITTKDSAKSVRLDCKAGEVFTLSNKNTASGTNILVIACFDANNTMLSRDVVSSSVKSVTATVPNRASFLIACFNDWSLVEEAQLEVGSTATTYEAPATSLPITVSWQTEAGTVYDGYIDVVSGVLTVGTAVETENGGNPYWQLNTGGVGRFYLPSLPSGLDTSRKAESICNVLTYKDDNTVYGPFFVYGGSGLYVNKISADETLEQFKTRISNPALQIIYPLAIPQTYQLTPQQISTLLGNNTVFVDCGSVSVTYQASIKGYIDKVLAS